MTKAKASPTPKTDPVLVAPLHELSATRHLMTENGRKELIAALYGDGAEEALLALGSKSQQQAVAAELMMAGLPMTQTAKAIGVSSALLSKWFSSETQEMQRLMKSALTRDALIELPATWQALKAKRLSENEETSRKAALDCMRAAGAGIDVGQAGQSISINAQNLQFNSMSVADLDQKILEIAAKIGPDAVKLAEGEVRGEKKSASPDADPPARAATADRGVPGAAGGASAP